MEFLILILVVVSFFWGYSFRERVAIYKTHQFLKIFREELESQKEKQKALIRIKIEKERNTFYVYDSQNSKFITQGNTKEELEKNLAKIFPGKKFGCTEDNLIKIGFIS